MLDEMVVRIAGQRMRLWRAVDHEGEVLDMQVQRRRGKRGTCSDPRGQGASQHRVQLTAEDQGRTTIERLVQLLLSGDKIRKINRSVKFTRVSSMILKGAKPYGRSSNSRPSSNS